MDRIIVQGISTGAFSSTREDGYDDGNDMRGSKMEGGSGGPLNSSSILDFYYNVAALAFIGVFEPWHKTGMGGWKMNEVEKENGKVKNKGKKIKEKMFGTRTL